MSRQVEFEIYVSEAGRILDSTNTMVDGQKLVGEYPDFDSALEGARRLAEAFGEMGWKVNVVRCMDFRVEDGSITVKYDTGVELMNTAETFKEMLSLSRTKRDTDAIMDAIFEAKVWKRGTPEHAKFGFEDGSGLALDSFDDSDTMAAST